MRLKLIFTLLFVSLVSMLSEAQRFTLGPEAGYVYAGYRTSLKEVGASNGNGFSLGISAMYNFTNGVFLQSGLSYSYINGGSLNNVGDKGKMPKCISDVDLVRIDYLTLPLAVGYEFKFPSGFGIGIKLGGYVATGIDRGSTVFRVEKPNSNGGFLFKDSSFAHYDPETDKVELINVEGSNRIDSGVLYGVNARYKQIRLSACYQMGLVKTIYDIARPSTITLSLAYDFNL